MVFLALAFPSFSHTSSLHFPFLSSFLSCLYFVHSTFLRLPAASCPQLTSLPFLRSIPRSAPVAPFPVSILFFHPFPVTGQWSCCHGNRSPAEVRSAFRMLLTMMTQIMLRSRTSYALACGLRSPFVFYRPNWCRSSQFCSVDGHFLFGNFRIWVTHFPSAVRDGL